MHRLAALALAVSLVACTTPLERGLDEAQADEIVVALADRGIGAAKESEPGTDGFAVRVSESDVARALSVMREDGLPRAHDDGVAEAYAEPTLVPTAGEERARWSAALAADLARSIETMPGVLDARVHVGLADPSVVPIDEAPPSASASVLVRSAPDAAIDETAIRTLVAGAVPGLVVDRVSVVRVAPSQSSTHAEPLVAVGPVFVAAGSAGPLRAILATMLAVNVLLALAAFAVVRRRPR